MESPESHPRFAVTPDEAHERLDVILARRLELSRAQTRRLLERGVVRIDGAPVGREAKGAALEAGTEVEVESFVHPDRQPITPDHDLVVPVLARGPGWLAIDKPAGVPVHPLEPDETGTALNAVAALHPEVQGVGEGGLRSGVVHRLDVDTSGAMLVAYEAGAWLRLRTAFAEHRVTKIYRAVVAGAPDPEGVLELRLMVAHHKPARVKIAPGRGGKPTRLRWRVLESFADASLVEVRLETGFLHQIRAGFAHLGHPVLGDPTYGPEHADRAPRQMLHSARLAFEEIAAESPDPADLALLLAGLRGA